MNEAIFHAINSLAGKNSILDSFAIFLAGNVFAAVWVGVIIAIWLKNRNLRNNVYLAFVSALISRGVIVELLKRIFDHPRPYEVLTNIHKLIVDNEHGMSFPSGHAVIYFSFAFAFWGTEYFWPFFILAVLGSVARVFVGVHFPADLLASFVLAALVVLAIRRLFKKGFLR